MLQFFAELFLFTSKTLVIAFGLLIVLIGFFSLVAKAKEKQKHQLQVKNLNKAFEENNDLILEQVLSKKSLASYLKEKKQRQKKNLKEDQSTLYLLTFNGDMKASTVDTLADEISAVLNVAKKTDEIVVRIESPGGVVHGYGLAAAELMRIRQRGIPLTVCIDKVAASGGYLMACVADKILAAPFAIIGSIGVVVQLPNFNRVLKEKNIDFEMHTAGEFKRTISLFGENTDAGREKLQHEIEDIHGLFKELIASHRPTVNIERVATGEYWLGKKALELQLIDEIKTSNEYLLTKINTNTILDISHAKRKSFLNKLMGTTQLIINKLKLFNVLGDKLK